MTEQEKAAIVEMLLPIESLLLVEHRYPVLSKELKDQFLNARKLGRAVLGINSNDELLSKAERPRFGF